MSEELQKLYAQRLKANARISEIEAAERREEQSKLVGKTFIYDNGYSSTQRWPLYTLVRSVDRYGYLTVFAFETDSNGQVMVRPRQTKVNMSSDHQPISRKRFDAAWAKVLAKLESQP